MLYSSKNLSYKIDRIINYFQRACGIKYNKMIYQRLQKQHWIINNKWCGLLNRYGFDSNNLLYKKIEMRLLLMTKDDEKSPEEWSQIISSKYNMFKIGVKLHSKYIRVLAQSQVSSTQSNLLLVLKLKRCFIS